VLLPEGVKLAPSLVGPLDRGRDALTPLGLLCLDRALGLGRIALGAGGVTSADRGQRIGQMLTDPDIDPPRLPVLGLAPLRQEGRALRLVARLGTLHRRLVLGVEAPQEGVDLRRRWTLDDGLLDLTKGLDGDGR